MIFHTQWHIPNLHFREKKRKLVSFMSRRNQFESAHSLVSPRWSFLIPAVTLCPHEQRNQRKARPLHGRVKSRRRLKLKLSFFLRLPECFPQQPQSSRELISCSIGFTKGGQRREFSSFLQMFHS